MSNKAEGGRRKAEETGAPVASARRTRNEKRETAFIALGSNLDDPVAQVRSGLLSLAALRGTRLTRTSSLYRNPPVGFLDQPEFVNAVAMVETGLDPHDLLDELLGIESAHGRARAVPNGPRTLDLDLALYGERVIREPRLIVPHPRLAERAFVLVPLLEIAPDTVVPGAGRVADLVKSVDISGMVRISDG